MVLAARPTLAEVPLADRSFATGSTIYAATSGGLSVGVVAVPEPSTYAMALAGLACGGFSMFRRRRAR